MSELSSVGQDSARQSETEHHQSTPGEKPRRIGQGPTKGRPVLKRAGQNVTGSGIVSRTGQGWREGHYWTVQSQAG